MLHFVLCTSGNSRDRGCGQTVWWSTNLFPAAQSVDVYSPGTQEEELTAVTDHRLVARLFSSKCLQQVIMDSGVLRPHPHDHTSWYWCLMSPPTRSHIPTSWLLVSYVPTHTLTHTNIMDTGVLCPHPKSQKYPHRGYWCLMSPPT